MAKPKEDFEDYQVQKEKNEQAFREILRLARPDVFSLMEQLDESSINWWVVSKVIRQLALMSIGTGYGQVTIQIENGKVTFIRGEESNRVNEPLIQAKTDELSPGE
jgi:hypothetical protein